MQETVTTFDIHIEVCVSEAAWDLDGLYGASTATISKGMAEAVRRVLTSFAPRWRFRD